jgi:hypothetical protein
VKPDTFAAVMATGIVSIAAMDHSFGAATTCRNLVACGVPAGNVFVGHVCHGRRTGWQWLTIVSVVFFWIAFAAWVITALRAVSRIGSPPAPDPGTRLDLAT